MSNAKSRATNAASLGGRVYSPGAGMQNISQGNRTRGNDILNTNQRQTRAKVRRMQRAGRGQ